MSAYPDNVARIFEAAVELETACQQAAYLDTACGQDAGLRAQVEELLPQPALTPRPPSPRASGKKRRAPLDKWSPSFRWALAAAVLLFLGSGFGLTEPTGVPKLTPTAIRVLTADGTLLVEVHDPQVKVTIEGDGAIVIAGAGCRDVRLGPDSYQLRATKDGKVVRKELVSITRGGKQVVRVSREGTARLRSAADEKKVIMGLYNRYCIRCHGVDGRGVWDIPKVRKFTDGRWQTSRSDAQIVRAILEGRGEAKPPFQGALPLPPPNRRTGILFWAVMPPFRGTLTLEEAWGMARYLRTFAPGTGTPRPDLDQTAKPAATPK